MKKILFIILTTASMLTASAQTMLKQRIDQEIGTIIVKNNTIVRIEKDTCNYVAYLSDLSGPAAEAIVRNLVEITDTKLITTEAAKDKTIIVGTTADSCSFTIVNDGIVIHKGKTYSNELGKLLLEKLNSKKKLKLLLKKKLKNLKYKKNLKKRFHLQIMKVKK